MHVFDLIFTIPVSITVNIIFGLHIASTYLEIQKDNNKIQHFAV